MYKTEYRYWIEDNGIIYDAEINIFSMQELFKNVVYAHNPDRLYYFNANHLGSGSLITDKYGQTYQTLIYAPHGEVLFNKFYGDYDEVYKFTGYEKDNESGLDYAKARYHEVNLGFNSTDAKWYLSPHQTSYAFCSNDPVNKTDPDGNFSISNHYKFTYKGLIGLGYSKKTQDLIAHYASVYADHPAKWITYQQGQHYRKDIDYSKTANSQNTASKENSTWHAMRADNENISNSTAVARGQEFGWSKIIESGSQTGTEFLESIGQGIHALQDAVAHNGVDMKHHSIWNDMYPSQADQNKSISIAKNAAIVSQVLSGDYSNVHDGMMIDITGTTTEQFETIKNAFQKVVNNSNNNINTINLVRAKNTE